MSLWKRVKTIIKSKVNGLRERVLSKEQNEKLDETLDEYCKRFGETVEEYYKRINAEYEKTIKLASNKLNKTKVGKKGLDKAFNVLKMKPTKDFSKIRKKWLKLMKKHHPDLHKNHKKKKNAEKKASEINEAYTLLKGVYGG